nr:glycosyltransferase family 9 protein [uncultured Rhodopila sp.]
MPLLISARSAKLPARRIFSLGNRFGLSGARAQRALSLVRATARERGWPAAAVVFARTVRTKLPLLVQQVQAMRQAAPIRAGVVLARDASADSTVQVAFCVAGGLGDFLVIARFVRDLAAHAGGFQFDIFSPTPKLAARAFAPIAGFRKAYRDSLFGHTAAAYDVAIRATQFAVIHDGQVRRDKVRQHPELQQVIDALLRFEPSIQEFVAHHPWRDGDLARFAVGQGADRRGFLHHMAGLPYESDLFPVRTDGSIATRLGLRPGGYITVHNGFDTRFVISGQRATKCYPHFGAVVSKLRAALPGYRFVQIGSVTSELIHEVDLNLVNKTSMDEVAGLLARAALHLDNEGGLVHLAACLGTRSAVVFGPTPADYFGYPDNINISSAFCNGCWWTTRTWMDSCAKGYKEARCMTEQDPGVVAARILETIPVPEQLAAD